MAIHRSMSMPAPLAAPSQRAMTYPETLWLRHILGYSDEGLVGASSDNTAVFGGRIPNSRLTDLLFIAVAVCMAPHCGPNQYSIGLSVLDTRHLRRYTRLPAAQHHFQQHLHRQSFQYTIGAGPLVERAHVRLRGTQTLSALSDINAVVSRLAAGRRYVVVFHGGGDSSGPNRECDLLGSLDLGPTAARHLNLNRAAQFPLQLAREPSSAQMLLSLGLPGRDAHAAERDSRGLIRALMAVVVRDCQRMPQPHGPYVRVLTRTLQDAVYLPAQVPSAPRPLAAARDPQAQRVVSMRRRRLAMEIREFQAQRRNRPRTDEDDAAMVAALGNLSV